jgi:hypothetical protein
VATALVGGGVAVVLSAANAGTAGAVLASRRPRHPVGWLLLTFGLGQLLGRDSSLVVAAATLVVAVAFQPARRRIQGLVDRRFSRRRYDAARTIAAFSGRLREQVNLDILTAELLAVTDRTVEPTTVSLWLRPQAERLAPPVGAYQAVAQRAVLRCRLGGSS